MVQDQNNKKLALLRDEIRLTQENVERIKEGTYTHTFLMRLNVYTLLRRVSMLSIRKCLSPLSSIFATLLVTNWHPVHTL